MDDSNNDNHSLSRISRRLFNREPTIEEYIINGNESTIDSYFTTTCQHTISKDPHPWQVEVGMNILRHQSIHQLLVRPTGGGKSMVYIICGILLKGITLCIAPLLSLGADQCNKIKALPRYGNDVFAYHLDEMTPVAVNYLADKLHLLSNLNKTVFLFASQVFEM